MPACSYWFRHEITVGRGAPTLIRMRAGEHIEASGHEAFRRVHFRGPAASVVGRTAA
jgi:hypothetical protein